MEPIGAIVRFVSHHPWLIVAALVWLIVDLIIVVSDLWWHTTHRQYDEDEPLTDQN